MLLKRLEIRNMRKIRQADIDFHGPGLQIIQGMNESGKTTLAQSIAITFGGTKEVYPGMISHGEEQAEIIAYTDNELKIRTVIQGSVKQTVYEKEATTGRYVTVSGGVRAFLDSLRSGLEMPWVLRNMTDAQIIEILKNRAGITKQIADIDAQISTKETTRRDVGRDKNNIGQLAPVKEANHPDPIDDIKAEREKTRAYQVAYADSYSRARENIHKALGVGYTFEELESVIPVIQKEVAAGRERIKEYKAYTKADVAALDKQIADWYELEEKAKAYDAYREKAEKLEAYAKQYNALTAEIEALRTERKKVLSNMRLGVKGLEIGEDNFLYHNGAVRGITDTNKDGNWSTAESVKVFFSVGAAFSGELKVLVVDNGESIDSRTEKAISDWAENSQFLVLILKVADLPDDLEEGIIYLKEGEVVTK